MENIIPVILAGGSGERLWPLSRVDFPKQFVLRDASGFSLFQSTLRRVADRTRFRAPVILCGQAHHPIVAQQLAEIGLCDATLLLEPVARNTAAAITLAACHIAEAEGLMLVLPSDHHIDAPEEWTLAIQTAAAPARDGRIVTFGITPTGPETGYGYIECGEELKPFPGVRQLLRFVEKPDETLAKELLRQGNFGWNSGMFLMAPRTLLSEMAAHAPAIASACAQAYQQREERGSAVIPCRKSLEPCPAIAFDYAVMEQTANAAIVPVNMGWRDMGGWAAIADAMERDQHGNSVVGEVSLRDTRDSLIHTSTLHVVAIGLQDMLVVEHGGHVLVAPKERAPEVRAIVRDVRPVAERPWGHFTRIDRGAQYQVKKLTITPGQKISLQAHRSRSEHWIVVKGEATVTRGDEIFLLWENQSTYIPAGQLHRLENRRSEDLVIIEVQTGNYLGEDDIERFEDAYARMAQSA